MKNLKVYNKELFKKKVVPIAIAASLFSGGLSFLAIDKMQESSFIPVSNDVRNSIYKENPKFSDENGYNYSAKETDECLTKQSLDLVETLSIDLENKENLSFLKYCDNLKSLTINNAQFLNDEYIDIIDNLDLEQLNLYLSSEHIDVSGLKTNSCFKKLKCDNIYVGFDCIFDTELKNYMLYLWGKKVLDNRDFEYVDKEKYQNIDDAIDNLMKATNIKKEKKDEDTVMNAVLGVCNYFVYDEEADIFSEANFDSSDSVDKLFYYNVFDLSSSLLDNGNTGVCVNFASILNAILYKLGIESYVLGGTSEGIPHALSIVKINDEWKYIDSTYLNDRFEAGDLGYVEYYCSTNNRDKNKNYNALKNNVLNKQAEESIKSITPDISIEDLTKEEHQIDVKHMYNSNSKTNDSNENIIIPIAVGVDTGLVILLIPTMRRRKKIYDAEKEHNKSQTLVKNMIR